MRISCSVKVCEGEEVMQESVIFKAALQLPPGERAAAYLDRACGDDAACCREVEGLLPRPTRRPGEFLAHPPVPDLTTGITAPTPDRPGSRVGPPTS